MTVVQKIEAMKEEYISWNGRIIPPQEMGMPLPELLAAHYVYQRVHTTAGKTMHLAEHLDIAWRTFHYIYGTRQEIDENTVAAQIAQVLRVNRYPARGSAVAMLCFFPRDTAVGGRNADDGSAGYDLMAMCERPLIEKGYAVSSLRPRAVSYEYQIPYSAFPTGFRLSAARMHDMLALEHGATRSVRREGDRMISCGDAPLFGIKRKTLFTASLTEGAVDSVERRLVIAAAAKAGMDFLEEAVPHSGMRDFDELFYADAAGITSLSECDGAKFMSLLVARLAGNL